MQGDNEKYLGLRRVVVVPETRDGVEGFAMRYKNPLPEFTPADVFHRTYRPINAMAMSQALELLLATGEPICRAGWRVGRHLRVNDGKIIMYRSTKTSQISFKIWAPKPEDLTATDWRIFDPTTPPS